MNKFYYYILLAWGLYCGLQLGVPGFAWLLNYRTILTTVIGVLCCVMLFQNKASPEKKKKSAWAALFLGLGVISVLHSMLFQYSLYLAIGLFCYYLFSFTGLRKAVENVSGIGKVFHVLSVSYFLIGLGLAVQLGIPQLGMERFQNIDIMKATGIAAFAVVLIPLCFYYTLCGRPFFRLPSAILGGYWVLALIASKGRTGILTAFLVCPLFILTFLGIKLKIRHVVLGMLLILTGYYLAFHTEAGRDLLRLDTDDISSGRFLRYESLWFNIKGSPLFGYGLGTNRYAYFIANNYFFSWDNSMENQAMAHNLHLMVWHDLGIFALLILWGYWLYVLNICRKIFFNPCPGILHKQLLVFAAIWLGFFIDSFSHDWHLSVGNIYMPWFWLTSNALIIGYHFQQKPTLREEDGQPAKNREADADGDPPGSQHMRRCDES